MRTQRFVPKLVLPCVAILLLAVPAPAQSLARFQAPGGRQLSGAQWVGDWIVFLPDDRFALVSVGDEMIPGDTNGAEDTALYDRWNGTYAHAVLGIGGAPPDGRTIPMAASANGLWFTVESDATNLGPPVTSGTNGYRVERQTGAIARITLAAGGVEPDWGATPGEISGDGRFAVFVTEATNILPGDTNAVADVFVRDLQTGAVELISVSNSGGWANGWSWGSDISADGRYVLFMSFADDIVTGDTNSDGDLFLRDRTSGTTTRVNVGPGGVEANAGVYYSYGMTPDARWITFDTYASNLHPLGGYGGAHHVYLLDRTTGAMTIESVGPSGLPGNQRSLDPTISDDGRFISFLSGASDLDPLDTDSHDDQFVRDVLLGTTRLVSISTGGNQGMPPPGFGEWLNGGTLAPTGRFATFTCNLLGLVAGDTIAGPVFVHDRSSPCAPIESFCTPKTNSLGCTPTITTGGEPYTTGPSDAFFVSAHSVRNNDPGLLLWSFTPDATPFFGGTLCLGGAVRRTGPQVAGGLPTGHDCSGTYSFLFSQSYMMAMGIGPAALVHCQYWSRDNGFPPPNNVGLTGGLLFVTSP